MTADLETAKTSPVSPNLFTMEMAPFCTSGQSTTVYSSSMRALRKVSASSSLRGTSTTDSCRLMEDSTMRSRLVHSDMCMETNATSTVGFSAGLTGSPLRAHGRSFQSPPMAVLAMLNLEATFMKRERSSPVCMLAKATDEKSMPGTETR